MIKIAAIDNDRLFLASIRHFMSALPDLALVRTATSVDEYLANAPEVDLVLLDVDLQDQSHPADNVARLRAAGCTVLVVTVLDSQEFALASMEAGAADYLVKPDSLSAFVDAIRKIANGETGMTSDLAFAITYDERPTGPKPKLSGMELAVLELYAKGWTLQHVANKLKIKYGTAREYLERVKRKYADVGRPAREKITLAERWRTDYGHRSDRLPPT